MKKKYTFLLAGALASILGCSQAGAEVFLTPDSHTLVDAGNPNGIVTVKVTGGNDWFVRQFCQDKLRAGCGNTIEINPFKVDGNLLYFQLDMAGVKDGQDAFHVRRSSDKKNLLIPDCRVKTGPGVGMTMSYYTADIPDSGGAHFVYTGSGAPILNTPIDASHWCDEQTRVSVSQKVTTLPTAKVGAGDGAMNQSVIKSPDSQNVQTKQIASPVTKIIGHGNKVKHKIVQQSSTINNKGATVNVKGSVSGKDCKDAKDGKDCVPGIDASTTNNTFSLISFGEGKKEGAKDVKDCVTMVDGKVSYNCNDAATTTTTTSTLKEVKK